MGVQTLTKETSNITFENLQEKNDFDKIVQEYKKSLEKENQNNELVCRYSDQALSFFENRVKTVLKQKQDIFAELSRSLKEAKNEAKNMSDQASDASNKYRITLQIESLRKVISSLENAVSYRIPHKNYGIDCTRKTLINPERLYLTPGTTQCIEEKNKQY